MLRNLATWELVGPGEFKVIRVLDTVMRVLRTSRVFEGETPALLGRQ